MPAAIGGTIAAITGLSGLKALDGNLHVRQDDLRQK